MAPFRKFFYVLNLLLLSTCFAGSPARSQQSYEEDTSGLLDNPDFQRKSLRELDHELTDLLADADTNGDLKSSDSEISPSVNNEFYDEHLARKRQSKSHSLRDKRKSSNQNDKENKPESSQRRQRRSHSATGTPIHHAFPRFRRGFHHSQETKSSDKQAGVLTSKNKENIRRRRDGRRRRYSSNCQSRRLDGQRHGRRTMPIEEERNISENADVSESNLHHSDPNWREKRNHNHALHHRSQSRQDATRRRRSRKKEKQADEEYDEEPHIRRKRDTESENDMDTLDQSIDETEDSFLEQTRGADSVDINKRDTENDAKEETEEDLANQLDSVMDEIGNLIPSDSNVENEIRAYLGTKAVKSHASNERYTSLAEDDLNRRKRRYDDKELGRQHVSESDDSEEDSWDMHSLKKRIAEQSAGVAVDDPLYHSSKIASSVNSQQMVEETNTPKKDIDIQSNYKIQHKGNDDDENDDETNSMIPKRAYRISRELGDHEAIRKVAGEDPVAQAKTVARLQQSLDTIQRMAREVKQRSSNKEGSVLATESHIPKRSMDSGFQKHNMHNGEERQQSKTLASKTQSKRTISAEDRLSLKNIEDINELSSQNHATNPTALDEATLSKREANKEAVVPTKISITFQSSKEKRSLDSEPNNVSKAPSLKEKRSQETTKNTSNGQSKRNAMNSQEEAVSKVPVKDFNGEKKGEPLSDFQVLSKRNVAESYEPSVSVENSVQANDDTGISQDNLTHKKRNTDSDIQKNQAQEQISDSGISETQNELRKRSAASPDVSKLGSRDSTPISETDTNNSGVEDDEEGNLEDLENLSELDDNSVEDEADNGKLSQLEKRHVDIPSKYAKRNVGFTVEHDQEELVEENRRLDKLENKRRSISVDKQISNGDISTKAVKTTSKNEKRDTVSEDDQAEEEDHDIDEHELVEQNNQDISDMSSVINKRASGEKSNLISHDNGVLHEPEKRSVDVPKSMLDLGKDSSDFLEANLKPGKRSLDVSKVNDGLGKTYSINIPDTNAGPEERRNGIMEVVATPGTVMSDDQLEMQKRSMDDSHSLTEHDKINIPPDKQEQHLELSDSKHGTVKSFDSVSQVKERPQTMKRNIDSAFEVPKQYKLTSSDSENAPTLDMKRNAESVNQIVSDLGKPFTETVDNTYSVMDSGGYEQSKRDTFEQTNLGYEDARIDPPEYPVYIDDTLPNRQNYRALSSLYPSAGNAQIMEDRITREAVNSVMPKIHPSEVRGKIRRDMGSYQNLDMAEENDREFNDYLQGKLNDYISRAIRKRHSPYSYAWENGKEMAGQNNRRLENYQVPNYSPELAISNRAGVRQKYGDYKRSTNPFYRNLPVLRRFKRNEDGDALHPGSSQASDTGSGKIQQNILDEGKDRATSESV